MLFTKMTNSVSEPPFGGVRGNVCTLSVARWKARGVILFAIIEYFFPVLTVETL